MFCAMQPIEELGEAMLRGLPLDVQHNIRKGWRSEQNVLVAFLVCMWIFLGTFFLVVCVLCAATSPLELVILFQGPAMLCNR